MIKKSLVAPLIDSVRVVRRPEVERIIDENCGVDFSALNFCDDFAVVFLALKYSEFENFDKTVRYIHKNFTDETVRNRLLKTLEKFAVAVEELSRTYKRVELKQALFDWKAREMREGFFDIPDGIGKLAMVLLDLKEPEKFLILGADSYKFAMNFTATNEKISVCGIGDSADSAYLGHIRSAVVDNRIEVKRAYILNENISEIKAEKIFVGFKGGRIHSRDLRNADLKNFCENICCREWAYTVAAMLSQKSGGRTVAILPENVLTNEADKEIRKKLLEAGKVEGIISLHPYGGIQFHLLIMSENNNSIKMLDATNFFTDGSGDPLLSDKDVQKILWQYNSGEKNFVEVPNEEIFQKNFVLNPLRYIAEKKISFESVNLSQIVSIRRGAQQIRPSDINVMKSYEPTDYHYLEIKNFTDEGIDGNLIYLKADMAEKYERYFLSTGDLAITKLQPFRVIVIPETDAKILPSENIYGLKILNGVNPYWLALFLKSEQGIMQLNSMASGGNIGIITPNNLGSVKIPKISSVEQDKIAEKYLNLLNELKKIRQKREAIIEQIRNLIVI